MSDYLGGRPQLIALCLEALAFIFGNPLDNRGLDFVVQPLPVV